MEINKGLCWVRHSIVLKAFLYLCKFVKVLSEELLLDFPPKSSNTVLLKRKGQDWPYSILHFHFCRLYVEEDTRTVCQVTKVVS